MKNRLGRPRSYCLVIIASIFVLSQIVATQIQTPNDLWKSSSLLGLAYGGVFGLYPTLCIEWFGLSESFVLMSISCLLYIDTLIAHFSANWGFVSLAPLFGGNLFSLAFGRNLDRHVQLKSADIPISPDIPSDMLARASLPSSQQCIEGRECYVSSLYLTVGACGLALALSTLAAWKDSKRMLLHETDSRRSMVDEAWEEG